MSTWNEYYTNARQSRDSNRNATNGGSTRTNFCVSRGRYDRQRTLVIRIAAITLASDSAITIARFRPFKEVMLTGFFKRGFCILVSGRGGVGEGLGRGWVGVGEGVGAGAWGGRGFLYFKNPVNVP